MKCSVKFEYSLKDRVMLNEIERPGTIDGLSFDSLGAMYRVVYWDDGDRHSTWVYSHEIHGVGK